MTFIELDLDTDEIKTPFDPNVGRGFDSIYGEPEQTIFKPDNIQQVTFPPYGNIDHFKFQLATSQREFTKITSTSASASGSYGLGKASASGGVKKFFNSNSYSNYLVGFFKKSSNPFDTSDITINSDVMNFIRTKYKERKLQEIERRLGDSVITGFNLAAELYVVARFESKSETKKKEVQASLSGSYGSFVSGGAKFAEMVKSVKSSSRTSIYLLGHMPDMDVELTSVENCIHYLSEFNTRYKEKLRVSSYIIRKIDTLNQLLNFDFVDDDDLNLRREFASDLDSLYQTYEDWYADIQYVLDENTQSEFAQAEIDSATGDKKECLEHLQEIEKLDRDSQSAWEKGLNWKSFFDLNLLDKFREDFPSYKQKETPVPPIPKKRRKKESPRYNDDRERGPRGSAGNRW